MTNPEISVVMPVYNASATLAATIASIQAQTATVEEIVVIDDGSTDDSLHKLLEIAAQDLRIRVVARDNGGVSSARNLGVAIAKAPLIAFIDADDIWDSGKIARHLALHRADPALAASYARIAFIDQEASGLEGARTVSSLGPEQLELEDVLGDNPVCTASNLVIRRDAFVRVGGFDDALSFAEDQEFLARLIANDGRIAGIDAVLTGYRYSPAGLSANLDGMYEGWRTVAARYLDGSALASRDALYCRYLARRVLRGCGSPPLALGYAVRGLGIDARAFLHERRRGFSTLLGAIAAPFMTMPMRRRVFA